MKILVVGGTGTIGRAVLKALPPEHQVLTLNRSNGDFQADFTDEVQIIKLFDNIEALDALVVTAGDIAFAPVAEMTSEQWQLGINSKLMGQINLARHAIPKLNDGGSITLTSGVLTNDPIPWGSSASAINAAIEGFVKGAAIELPRGIRINAVSPTLLEESVDVFGDYFQGFVPVPGKKVGYAYRKSVLGGQTGQVYEVS